MLGDMEPIGINLGGVKINTMANTSSFGIGHVFYQAVDSQSKNNMIAGQIFGDMNLNNVFPTGSTVFDPDGVDTMMPMNMSPAGLED